MQPHLFDIRNLDMNWTKQLHVWLMNSGFVQPMVTDLNLLSNFNVVFAGMVKDADKTLPHLIAQLEIFGCAFNSAHFFILESNSVDHTREIIREWKRKPSECETVHQSLMSVLSFNVKQLSSDVKQETRNAYRTSNHRIFHSSGNLTVIAFQPNKEFEEITSLMQRKDTELYYNVREEKYVTYRNFLLQKVKDFSVEYTKTHGIIIDYLFWIDMDLRGFDIESIAHEFVFAWRAGFDVVCSNGVKYTGWYYDSYATVYEDGAWAYGAERWRITNRIRGERFYEMKSCFGGLAAYSLPFIIQTKCKYEHFGTAYEQFPSFRKFADVYHVDRTCEHLPFNFCVREHGGKLALASEAHSLYGTGDRHG